MSRYLTSRRLFLLLGSVIVLMVIAGLTLAQSGRRASFPERVVMDVENTVAGWIYRPVSKITGFFAGLGDMRSMYQENAQLKHEMQKYQALRAELSDAEAENQRLATMLNFYNRTKNTLHEIPAAVVGREPSEWNSQLTINVGTADGVQPNMAVVAPDGSLVGRVDTVATHSAKVILITDTQVGDGVAALVEAAKAQPFAVVTGSGASAGELALDFLGQIVQMPASQLIGDEVITSGLSNVFPRGLVIGTITKVQYGAHNTVKSAIVEPAAQMDYLQDVFVVRQSGSATP
ncbi:cell shape-determining protein MreC [Alicyclobacillus hesperidum]|uniref:Cell shape-determining protein MreC n=1 Tax=Alicyclobacillus hesperidum TaxID=89784 RepID=A0A1H2T886_9BACL|nr:rod shape-determining protein MreC [Alicyclobacillus hesperidum]GLV13796.1 cell shape-determining protein MreC [Alicyclobacillus hesperidum]SDW40050.1 rod shape-determining protein MreC [Alicyclobacillus hesperidum]